MDMSTSRDKAVSGDVGLTCECPPCPGRGNDGHRMTHCAECCFGTGVEPDLDCPIHGEDAVQALRDVGLTEADDRLRRHLRATTGGLGISDLDTVVREAEQRGAVQALRDAADDADNILARMAVRMVFWQCLVPEHAQRRGVVTVEWKDGVAHCTYPNCDLTSEHTDHFKETVIRYHPDLDVVIEYCRWVLTNYAPPTRLDPPIEAMKRLLDVRRD